ncbi:hypothetical protein M405DRAFT_883196 [Rhizopogon salebrosus TDB-379]|nr:hypothetical protein M405DRAFT_883196 [Rhizopogon salebrosus TDB-379]
MKMNASSKSQSRSGGGKVKEVRSHAEDSATQTKDLHAKIEATLEHLKQEAEDKDAELRAASEEIEHLGKQVYALEEDVDRMKIQTESLWTQVSAPRPAGILRPVSPEDLDVDHMSEEHDHLREEEAAEREALAPKDHKPKLFGLESKLHDLQESYDLFLQDIHARRTWPGELAGYIDDFVNEVNRGDETHESLNREFDDAEKTNEYELRHERRASEDEDSAPLTTSPARNPISQHENDP